jgi:hypothetical protein
MLLRPLAVTMLVAAIAAAEPRPPAPPTPAVAAARGALQQALLAELAIDDARRQAWAAYQLGACGLASSREALLPLARLAPAADDAAAKRRFGVVIDALVRLQGTTPADVVALAATHRHLAEAIILAAREPSAHQAMLEDALAGQPGFDVGDGAWLAARQLLLGERSSRLAEDLARDLELRLRVAVVDPGKADAGGGMSGARSGGRVRVEDDFPPKAVYELSTGSSVGAAVLVKDVGTVSWSRREFAVSGTVGGPEFPLDRDQARIDLLAQLCRPWLMTWLKSDNVLLVTWSDAKACRDQVATERARLLQQREDLLEHVAEQGLLGPEHQERFPPKLVIRVDDQRADRTVALPALDVVAPPTPKRAEF